MTKKGFFQLVVVVILAFAAIFTVQAFNASAVSTGSSRPSIGMGDLHFSEAAQGVPVAGASQNARVLPGIGDLRRVEAQQSNRPYAGMGDLHFAETALVIPVTAAPQTIHFTSGFGDLRRIEALQSRRSFNGMGDLHLFEAGE